MTARKGFREQSRLHHVWLLAEQSEREEGGRVKRASQQQSCTRFAGHITAAAEASSLLKALEAAM